MNISMILKPESNIFTYNLDMNCKIDDLDSVSIS